MSTTIIAVLAQILVEALPKLGVNIGSDQITTTIQTLVVLGGAFWIAIRRHQVGDINILGIKK